jgi:C4-dicarboxylate-specific signal transduction histidine kinase
MVNQHQILFHEKALNYELGKLTRKMEDLSRARAAKPSAEIRWIVESTLKEVSAIIDTLGRAARGEIRLEASNVPLKEKLNEVICQIDGGGYPNVRIENKVPERFCVFTFWDPLKAVLEICLSNALTAAAREQGGRVILSGNFREDQLEYSIEIRNPGYIRDDVLKAILNRRPVLSNTGVYGIGLVIANNQLDLLGGRLQIRNLEEGVLTKLTLGDMRWL